MNIHNNHSYNAVSDNLLPHENSSQNQDMQSKHCINYNARSLSVVPQSECNPTFISTGEQQEYKYRTNVCDNVLKYDLQQNKLVTSSSKIHCDLIDIGFDSMDSDPHESLNIVEYLLSLPLNISNYKRAIFLQVKLLHKFNLLEDALQVLNNYGLTLDVKLLLEKSMILQGLKRFAEAEPVMKRMCYLSSGEHKENNMLALGRIYELLGKDAEALDIYSSMYNDICDNKADRLKHSNVALHFGIILQKVKCYEESCDVLLQMRLDLSGNKYIPCKVEKIEITIGRAQQSIGDFDGARETFLQMRKNISGDKSKPCGKKNIELAIGRLYQITNKHDEALNVFLQMRENLSGSKELPCKDKIIELTIGRQYLVSNQEDKAIETFLCMRIMLSGCKDTICKDKEVELSISRAYQYCNMSKKALELLFCMREQLSGNKDTPCNDTDIELGIASQYTSLRMWKSFDQMNLMTLCNKVEVLLCNSIRYFREIVYRHNHTNGELISLLYDAIYNACEAVKVSNGLHSSSLRQLGHCMSLLSNYTNLANGIGKKECENLSAELYGIASKLDPDRVKSSKDENWRLFERYHKSCLQILNSYTVDVGSLDIEHDDSLEL